MNPPFGEVHCLSPQVEAVTALGYRSSPSSLLSER